MCVPSDFVWLSIGVPVFLSIPVRFSIDLGSGICFLLESGQWTVTFLGDLSRWHVKDHVHIANLSRVASHPHVRRRHGTLLVFATYLTPHGLEHLEPIYLSINCPRAGETAAPQKHHAATDNYCND